MGLAAAAWPGTGQPEVGGSTAVAVVLRTNRNEEMKKRSLIAATHIKRAKVGERVECAICGEHKTMANTTVEHEECTVYDRAI